MKKAFRSSKIAMVLVVTQLMLLFLLNVSSSAAESPGTLLEEFDAIGSWKVFNNSTIAVDTGIKISGTGSMKISSTVAGGGGELNIEGPFAAPKDLSSLKNLEINVYAADLSSINTVSVFFSD